MNFFDNKAHSTETSYAHDHNAQTLCSEQSNSLIQNYILRSSCDSWNVHLACNI